MRLLFQGNRRDLLDLPGLRNNHHGFMVILMHINDFVGVHQ
jgi:hypothetical protein